MKQMFMLSCYYKEVAPMEQVIQAAKWLYKIVKITFLLGMISKCGALEYMLQY